MPITQVTVPGKFGFAGSDVSYAQGTGTVSASKQEIDNANAYLSQQSSAPAPTSAPAPVQAPQPTIAETLQGIKDKALGIQDQLNQMNKQKTSLTGLGYDTTENQYQVPLTESQLRQQERDIQRSQMRLFQKEIDATNQVYNDMLNQERLAGQGRLGTQTAMAARGGLLGSDFGEAQRQNQVGFNLQSERAVENERLAKIGTIMGTMRKAVADEIANKRLARQQDADSYTKYLASAKDRKTANLKLAATALLDSGIDIDSMSPEELAAIGKEANLSANDIIMAYKEQKAEQDLATSDRDLKTRKTEAEISKIDADIASGKLITIGEGTTLYNTETGESFKNPKTYAPGTGKETDVFTDKDLPGDVRTELLDDIANSAAAKDGTLTPEILMASYPEISTETIQSFYDNYYSAPEEPSGGADGKWWTFWD